MYIWTLEIEDEQHIDSSLIDQAQRLLCHKEQQRATCFLQDSTRNRFILAHALCRVMLSCYGAYKPKQWLFRKENRGRPHIDSAMNQHGLDFNISHTYDRVGCALGLGRRVGLDLELKSRSASIDALVKRQFAPAEQAQFFNCRAEDRKRLFFQFWTLREAYIKVKGLRLIESPSEFSFDLTGESPICYSQDGSIESYCFGLFDAGPIHQGAWAVKSRGEQIVPEMRVLQLTDFSELIQC